MKKYIIMFFAALVCLINCALFSQTSAEELKTNKKWFNTKLLKTYIPPNNQRTVMMQHAFAEWTKATNNQVIFRYVNTPNAANIIVEFVDTIPNADREIGLTKYNYTQRDKIVYAKILIANRSTDGKVLGNDSVYTVMLHEIGHALGIANHSENPKSIMFPYEDDIQEILNSDIKTLSDIYNWK